MDADKQLLAAELIEATLMQVGSSLFEVERADGGILRFAAEMAEMFIACLERA